MSAFASLCGYRLIGGIFSGEMPVIAVKRDELMSRKRCF